MGLHHFAHPEVTLQSTAPVFFIPRPEHPGFLAQSRCQKPPTISRGAIPGLAQNLREGHDLCAQQVFVVLCWTFCLRSH